MTLCADDGETSGLLDLGGELDVGTTTCHVGGDGHGAGTACEGYYLRLLLVEFGIEHLAVNLAHVEHSLEQLGNLDRGGADKHGTACVAELDNLLDDGGVFLLLGLVDAVLQVETGHGTVGRDGHHIEFVDVPKLTRLGLGGTGHTGELVVHTEVVLQGDCREGLGGGLYLHPFLGLDGLVETVAVTATLHDTACLLVDNLDFPVVDDIFVVFLEEGVCFQKLCHGVDTLRFDGVVGHRLILELLAFGDVCDILKFRQLGGDVGEDEELGILVAVGQHIEALVGKLHGAVLLVNHEVEGIGHLGHLAGVVLEVICLGLQQGVLHTLLAEELDQRAIFGKTLEGTE